MAYLHLEIKLKRTVTTKQYSYEKFIFKRCLFESNWLQFM